MPSRFAMRRGIRRRQKKGSIARVGTFAQPGGGTVTYHEMPQRKRHGRRKGK